MYSRSGIGSLLMSHGVTRWIFFQDRVHVDDEVLDHGHVAHGLDLDDAVARALLGDVEVRVAGEPGLPVDPHAARAADRGAARAADADRAVEARLGLEDPLEDGAVRLEVDRVLVPVRRVARLGVVAPQPQGEVGHQTVLRAISTSSLRAATS
jgi:hypothetical protein